MRGSRRGMGGPYPSNLRSTSTELLRKAAEELRWLINRGYPQESALNFVANHYRFPATQRNILVRVVFSAQEVKELGKRKARPEEVRNKELGIDGYNVLITVEAMLSKKPLYLCDDGWVRDASAVFGKYRINPKTRVAIRNILQILDELKPKWFEFLFEKQMSWSGKLAELVRKEISEAELDGSAKTSANVDFELRKFSIIATSDHAIALKHHKVLDLPALLVERLNVPILRL